MYVSKIQGAFEGEELYWKSKETQIQFGKFTDSQVGRCAYQKVSIRETKFWKTS
jgi:hypothetical protein